MAVLCATGAARAQTLKTIWSFPGSNGDGQEPLSPPVFDGSGNIYGTTAIGGASQFGTVFKLTPPNGGGPWTESLLYSFAGADGQQPNDIVFGKGGALYGTTELGGLGSCYQGCGTAFQLTPGNDGWTYAMLYDFMSPGDGESPGNLQLGKNGALYGTTVTGGPPSTHCSQVGCGTFFQLSQQGGSWAKTVLHDFPASTTDGRGPNADIVVDSKGNVYGTTYSGGSLFYGTVFEFSPPAKKGGAWTETILHNFSGSKDGGYPIGGLTLGAGGVIYGTGSYSGVPNQSGTAFRLTPPAKKGGAWAYTVVRTFNGDKNGATPATTMALDPNGNLYGTAWNGGSTRCYLGCGLVFKLQPVSGKAVWKETVLHDWPNSQQDPNATIVMFHDELLYGTTLFLGANNVGSVFTLTP